MAFKVTITTKEPGVYVVQPHGAIDSSNSDEFERQIRSLLKPETKVIILNMKDVDTVTSMGLGVVFKVKRYLQENQGALMMTDLNPRVKRVFELVKAIPEYLFANMIEVDAVLDKFLAEMERLEKEKEEGNR